MNVTTFTPATRKRISFPSFGILSIFKKVFSSPKRIGFIILAILAVVGIYAIFFNNQTNAPVKILPLKQSFQITALTKDGRTTNGTFKVDVTGAYRAPQLLVQGQNVIARNNKDFMVVNMQITNNYNQPLYVYPVDSFRLIDSSGKKFAPTAHQGNVEVRPQSTKNSNVGFIVPTDQSKFKVEVGGLNSDKVILEFSL